MSYLALLRGINVGGNHKLPMQDLRALLEGLGCTKVRTYIQSGNAAFEASSALAKGLPQTLPAAIHKKFGFDAPVVLRSLAQCQAVLKANPFLKGSDEEHLYVGFLANTPAPALVRALDPERSPGDAFAVKGSEIYLHLPKGGARSKLTNAWFDSSLKTVCTFRNWRTTQALCALAGAD